MIGEIIRRSRGKTSREELAHDVGYPALVIAAWESGRCLPTPAQAKELDARLGTDTHGALVGPATRADLGRALDSLDTARFLTPRARRVICGIAGLPAGQRARAIALLEAILRRTT